MIGGFPLQLPQTGQVQGDFRAAFPQTGAPGRARYQRLPLACYRGFRRFRSLPAPDNERDSAGRVRAEGVAKRVSVVPHGSRHGPDEPYRAGADRGAARNSLRLGFRDALRQLRCSMADPSAGLCDR